MGDNRPPVYIEDDDFGHHTLIIRASAVGHPCLWELIAAGQGEPMQPVPATLQRAFDEGNELEPVIIQKLKDEYGFVFHSHQEEGHLWLSENVAVRYHSDGIATDTNPSSTTRSFTFVVEAKALSNELWLQAKRTSVGDIIDEYKSQLSVMMHAEELPGLWVAYNKGLPPDKDGNRPPCPDQGKLLLEYVYTPPVSIEEIQLKASLIKEGVYGEEVITSDRQCDSPDHWPCRYLNIRPQPEDRGEAREIFIPSDTEAANRLITEYVAFKGQADEAKARYTAARDELIRMAGTKAAYIQTDRWLVPLVNGTSVSTNTSAMSPELLKVIEKYKVRKPTRFIRGVRRLGF